MKRRDLIKTGLLGLGASAAIMSGCNKEEISDNSDELKIIPKQTGIYEFSVPMPFNYKTIDEIVELNKSLTKSKITTLYNSIPNPLGKKFNRWVHIERGNNYDIKSYNDVFKYVDYAKSKGFEFVYLMNSPKAFSKNDFLTFKDELVKLLKLLIKHDIKNIKVASNQVIELINKFAPGYFNLSASCVFEYKSVEQYRQLFSNYPNFNLIDVTYDENQNFRYLKALKDKFPKIKLELMLNEQCIKFCPARIVHVAEESFCQFDCKKIFNEIGGFQYFLKTSVIFPWNLEYYSAIGINNFKFTAAGFRFLRGKFENISGIKTYLNIIEQGSDDFTTLDFNLVLPGFYTDRKFKLTDIIPLFPDIRHFIAHGHECAYKCGTNCNYCYKCAKKLENFLLYS